MTNERLLCAFESTDIPVIPSSQTKTAPQPEKVVENDVTFEILLGTGAMLVAGPGSGAWFTWHPLAAKKSRRRAGSLPSF